MTPIRIQRSRQHKQVSPNGLPIVYVGRPSKWGNPFVIGGHYKWGGMGRGITTMMIYVQAYKWEPGYTTLKTSEECIEWFEKYMQLTVNLKDVPQLRGKNLSCWCKIGEPCHGDILLRIANPPTPKG